VEKGVSFYFFDFDDNIIHLPTCITLRHKRSHKVVALTTQVFASVQVALGKWGKWVDYELYEDSFMRFGERPESMKQERDIPFFVEDIEKALTLMESEWQAPSWPLFVHACNNQRPLSIITARNHSPETIKAGIRVLVNKGLIAREPNYLSVFPVGNPEVRREIFEDINRSLSVAALKKLAIKKSVGMAVERYGAQALHRFGMSDDDPVNINLIISAMRDSKQDYPHFRFFVINTHVDGQVKLEVFPVDQPVTSNKRFENDII
jgi:hypothetical protein